MSDYEPNPDAELTLPQVTKFVQAFIFGGQPTISQEVHDILVSLIPDATDLVQEVVE